MPDNLRESDMFGHEKGAFTAVTVTRKGRFKLANNGTLFLDEVSETSTALQVKLLRVLRENVYPAPPFAVNQLSAMCFTRCPSSGKMSSLQASLQALRLPGMQKTAV
jgi:sigma54-dependent transcription regulator